MERGLAVPLGGLAASGGLEDVKGYGTGFTSEGRNPDGRGAILVACDALDISVEGTVGSSSEPVAGLGGGGVKSQGRGTIAAGMILTK
jgi:hypothetical protein